jgi:hypothetical protein
MPSALGDSTDVHHLSAPLLGIEPSPTVLETVMLP